MSRPTRQRGNKNVEAGYPESDRDVGLPRLVARIWGLVAGISYVSNGGYLLVKASANEKCQGAGAYMIVAGLATIIMECACCLCTVKNNCCDKFENKFPFWAKGLVYFASVIPPLAICFGVKTVISSIIVIMLGLIYVFLTCLTRSKKYERLQGEARVRYQEQRNNARVTYSAISATSNAVNFLKTNAAASKQQKAPRKGGKKPQKQYKSGRRNTAAT